MRCIRDPLGCEIEEFNHFRVEKLDAAAAGWFANLILMIRAVEVDIAVVAIMAVSLIVAAPSRRARGCER